MLLAVLVTSFALADPGSVRIGATVTDAAGKPVAGLTVKDFELREDGVLQKIDAVEARKPEPRRLAILLDEFHVDAADSARVRETLARFLETAVRPDDAVMILKPLDSLTSIRLTTDRAAVLAAIASFEGRKGNYEPRSMLEEETMGRSPRLVEASRAQVVLSGLRALAAQLGTSPGRSAILLVSEGFVPQARRASTSRGLPDVGIVERFANRYDVPIYAFDPRLIVSDGDAGSVAITRLVTETGGTLTRGAEFDLALARAARELDGGYILTYVSANGEDGRYHPVKLSAAKGQARTRAGYVSPPSAEMRARAARMVTSGGPALPTRALRRSPLIDVWSGITRVTPTDGRVVVTWEPGRNFTNTAKSPATRVTLTATTPEGKVLFEGTLAQIRPGESSGGSSDRAEFDAPSGRVQLDMTIFGLAGEKLDFDARDLDVPSLKGKDPVVMLPPILIATQSAREFRVVSMDAKAAPDPSREFRRTERLLIRVPAYSGGEPAPVTVRLVNRVGQPMKDLEVLPNPSADSGVTQFDLVLAPLAPGDYSLLISVQGPTGPVQQRVSFKITG